MSDQRINIRPTWQQVQQFERELSNRNQALVDFKSNEYADWLRLIQWFRLDWTLPEELAVASKLRLKYADSSAAPRDIPIAVLIHQMKSEFSRSNPSAASTSAASSSSPGTSSGGCFHSGADKLTQAETKGSVDWKTLSQAYLKRRSDKLPSEIGYSSFRSYLKYVGRKELTNSLLQQMQQSYSAFLRMEDTPYYKNLHVAYGTGALGMGKVELQLESARTATSLSCCCDFTHA